MAILSIKNILENILTEVVNEKRRLSQTSRNVLNKASDDFAKQVYGDDYGKRDHKMDVYFPEGEDEIYNNADVPAGLFAIGNEKLSDDTLIMNFTSALGCPSINSCPITQKACYAVAGENRLHRTRRKNILVQKLLLAAMKNNMLEGFFRIAELYIIEAKKSVRPIKYIRFNEVGDFPNQKILILAAKFAKMARDKYGILSMAYTAKKGIDPSEEVDGEPIDMIIAMNRSRSDIPRSENSLDRKFFGIEMPRNGFSTDPNINLENAYCDVVEVSDDEANNLKCELPIKGKYGIPSVPLLNYGKWNGGEGYYYVCPCSFWKYNKDKAEKEILVKNGIMSEDEPMPQNNAQRAKFNKRIPKELKDKIKNILKGIHSPCGIKCAVCHDLEGGVTSDGKNGIKDYVVLTATHGATAGNYKAEYANAKRNGNDTVIYDKNNPHGHETKYRNHEKETDKLLKSYSDEESDQKNEIIKQQTKFNENYNRFFGKQIL